MAVLYSDARRGEVRPSPTNFSLDTPLNSRRDAGVCIMSYGVKPFLRNMQQHTVAPQANVDDKTPFPALFG